MVLVLIFVYWIQKEVFVILGLLCMSIGGIFVGPWKQDDSEPLTYFGTLLVQGGASLINFASVAAIIRCCRVVPSKDMDIEKAELSQLFYLIFLTLGLIAIEIPLLLTVHLDFTTAYAIMSFASAIIMVLYSLHWCYKQRKYREEADNQLPNEQDPLITRQILTTI